ncbi:MAG: PQQ-binding-like beta-propeller repeat protein, partial [Verrucomicrobia bacterium]|nr:PQQ-binding-like beta-propeller repeat protein [Verrucomicrobiota bacterium]
MTRILFCLSILSLAAIAHADDWPTYRADAQRSAYTRENLPEKLTLQWSYQPKHAPRPAWPSSIRLSFDRAHHPVIAAGQLYFGSSVDGKVYALDAKSGAPLWDFFTDGPIRFAPVVWKDRLFVVSDDGHLYALSTADGKLLWKKRGGPQHRLILGNARMASRWPARGGPVVEGDTVYFASGIWPSDGLFLYAT